MASLLDVVPGSVDLLLDAWPAQEELQARWPAALRVRLSAALGAGSPQAGPGHSGAHGHQKYSRL